MDQNHCVMQLLPTSSAYLSDTKDLNLSTSDLSSLIFESLALAAAALNGLLGKSKLVSTSE